MKKTLKIASVLVAVVLLGGCHISELLSKHYSGEYNGAWSGGEAERVVGTTTITRGYRNPVTGRTTYHARTEYRVEK